MFDIDFGQAKLQRFKEEASEILLPNNKESMDYDIPLDLPGHIKHSKDC